MSYEQFWDGEPNVACAYRKKHELFIEQTNQILWLQGLYNYEAVSVALDNAFRRKGKKARDYSLKPYDITKHKENIQKQKENEKIVDNFRNQLDSLAKHFRGGDNNGS